MELPLKSSIEFSNGTTVHLALHNGEYLGISGATLNGVPFLVPGRGSLPYMQTPDGICYRNFHPLSLREDGEARVLEMEIFGDATPVMADLDLFGFPRISAQTGRKKDRLFIRFEPRSVLVAGEGYQGFSLSYEWSSGNRKIHWLYESVALAPGGTIEGARIMAQNMTQNFCRLEQALTKESAYSTQEHYDQSCIEAPCRGGGSQIFDLVQSPSFAVVSFFEEPHACGNALKANCQTIPGEDFVTVSDFHYGKLSGDFVTAPRVIVATPGKGRGREEAIDRWTAWYDFTAQLWCEKLGLHQTRVTPALTFEGTGAGGIDIGMAYPELLEAWSARLDWVKAQGFKAINLHTPEWISAANRRTMVFGGNNCCPWEYKMSEHLGGEAGLKAFCSTCHARGIKVFVWIAGHLHREAPILKKHPEWAVQRADRGLWDGHYGVIQSLSFVEGARDWIFQDLKRLREVTGVDGVWFDSFTNLSLGAINWQRPDRAPNAPAVLDFLADLSRLGYEIMIESMSQLGVSSWGNLKPSELAGQEELLINSSLRYYLRIWKNDPAMTESLYFRSLAARAPLGVWVEEFIGHAEPFPLPLPKWFGPLTRAFNEVEPRMFSRRILPGGALWYDKNSQPSAFFAFRDGKFPAELAARATDVIDKTITNFALTGKIYRLQN